ncbi:MAG: FliA/WhiG family RNA polymerase sigma factor [SAR116 cluster bacterium]|nr:FliA/WhiG family RNA polymerase sigma factor [SAR116 cluster bacterium]RPH11362.1 MAG: FliA/WhiG family RNA polymerase sigma factor [Alphaproteobacteria bacterium TMED54]|tara:strand:+ start:614 stop:1333 length:720 start_codon:yes stop_codon:yes gene_type:complete
MNNYQKISAPKVEDLIKNNHKLVKKIAWHLHGRVQSIIDIEDLIQIGMLGLISAAQNYTPMKDASFSSYASLRIRGEIVDYLRKNSNLCRSTIKMKKMTDNAIENLNKKFGREPDTIEISQELNIDHGKYLEWEAAFQASTMKNIDDIYDEFSFWFASKEDNPEQNINNKELKQILKNALSSLDEKQAMLIQLYYVEELNIYEIADILNISTGRVSQIKSSVLKIIRSKVTKELENNNE